MLRAWWGFVGLLAAGLVAAHAGLDGRTANPAAAFGQMLAAPTPGRATPFADAVVRATALPRLRSLLASVDGRLLEASTIWWSTP